VTRDAWISEVGPEADGNNGGAPRLKLKSIQEMSLLDFDPKSLLGRTIRSAVLHLKKAGDEPLKRVTVSSIGAEWFVDWRRRHLPRDPGQRRHDLAHG
jgi:hypothetical protein